MNILKNQNLLIFKVCLALFVFSLIIVARELVYHDTGLMLAWSALIFLIISLFFTAWFVGNDNSSRSSAGEPLLQSPGNNDQTTDTGFNLLAWNPAEEPSANAAIIHYLLHLVNPEMKIETKVGFGLRQLPELMPENIFAFFLFEEGRLRYIAGARKNSRQHCELISAGDNIVEELAGKIKNCLDVRSARLTSNFTTPITFSRSGKIEQGMLLPVSFCGNLQGVLASVCSGTDVLNNGQKVLLKHFCESLALLLENHQLYLAQTASKYAKAENELTTTLLSSQLPVHGPAIKGWDIAQVARYASEHSGDFHDYINLSGNRLMIIIGKCSGKGLATAVFFTRFRAMIACLIDQCPTPADLLNKLSTCMTSETTHELFATVAAIELRGSDKKVTLALAGHALPLINRSRSGFVELPQLDSGVPLGLFNQGVEPYQNQTIQLLPGDGILLYTEGATEFATGGKERIGTEELKQLLDRLPEQSANIMLENLADQLVPVKTGLRPGEDHTLIYAKTE